MIWLQLLPSILIIEAQWKCWEHLEFNLNETQKEKLPRPYEHERYFSDEITETYPHVKGADDISSRKS